MICAVLCLSSGVRAERPLRIGVPCFQGQACKFLELELILREAFSRAGLRAEFSGYPMLRDLEEANAGHLDGSGTRTPIALRGFANMIQVPTPIARIHYALFSNEPLDVSKGWGVLDGLRIGVKRGDMTAKYIAAENELPAIVFNDPARGFQVLAQGRLDVIIYDTTLGRAAAQEAGVSGYRVSQPVYSSYTYLSLNRRHKALVPHLARILAEMNREGTTRQLAGRFGNLIPELVP